MRHRLFFLRFLVAAAICPLHSRTDTEDGITTIPFLFIQHSSRMVRDKVTLDKTKVEKTRSRNLILQFHASFRHITYGGDLGLQTQPKKTQNQEEGSN